MFTHNEDVTAHDLTANIQVGTQTYKTNMKFSKKKTAQQQFLMYGPKFFDELRIYLIKNSELREYALPSSALATYILLHYKVNDLGQLSRDFKLSDIANESGIPYSTIHTGFQALLHSGLVREIFIKGIPVYEICNYARLNRTSNETKDKDGKLSYFRIPNLLLETSILKELVSRRDNKGIIQLLELCNNFTRELDKNKKSIEDYILTRKMDTLKERLGRNAKKVREYLALISPLFKFEAAGTKIRNPREARIRRIREKIKQVIIPRYIVSMNAACVIENDRAEMKQAEAKMRKEAITRLKSVGIALTNKDRKDITVAFKNEISKIAAFIKNNKLRNGLMTYTMSYAMDQFEAFIIEKEQKVNSIGAFVRAKLRESLVSWRNNYLDDHTRDELVISLASNDIEIPDAFRLT